jgi:hypothetical protein
LFYLFDKWKKQEEELHCNSGITWVHYASLAFLDAVRDVMLFLPSGVVSTSLVYFLPQLPLPFVILTRELSKCGHHSSRLVISSFLSLGAVSLIVLLNLGLQAEASTSLSWNTVFLLFSLVPSFLSYSSKESLLQRNHVPRIYSFDFTISLLEALFLLLFYPIGLLLQYIGCPTTNYKTKQMFVNLKSGFQCIFNKATDAECDFQYLWVPFLVYLVLLQLNQISQAIVVHTLSKRPASQFSPGSTLKFMSVTNLCASLAFIIVWLIPASHSWTKDPPIQTLWWMFALGGLLFLVAEYLRLSSPRVYTPSADPDSIWDLAPEECLNRTAVE